MAFKLAEAYVEFSQKGVNQVNAGVKNVKSSMVQATTATKALSAAISTIGAVGVLRSLWGFVEAAAEAEKQTAKLAAVLKATEGASGQTVESLEAHASALQRVTAFEDDTIKGAQAVLLTFKKIGGETFPQATEAALDLATVFEGDLRGAAMMVGKALQDPIRGITALRRAGVDFTKDQQDVIKSLVETGKAAEAQAMILGEIKSQVGGSAREVGETTSGKIDQLKNSAGDLAKAIGERLIPHMEFAADAFKAWAYMLGGEAAMLADFGKQASGMGERFLKAKTSSEAEGIQKEYFALLKDMKKQGMLGAPATVFGSRAANARIAALRDKEAADQARYGNMVGLGKRMGGIAGRMAGSLLDPSGALGKGGKSAMEGSTWLKDQLSSQLRSEQLLKGILDKIAPDDDVARYR